MTQLRPMKLGEVRSLIVDDVRRGEPSREALAWLDRLRVRGWPPAVLPFKYDDLLAFVREGEPKLERAEWDAYLARCDELSSQETDR